VIKVTVTERPQRVRVEYDGVVHTARWRSDETLSEVVGNESLLRAALTAWLGDREFEISPEDLGKRSGGWWTPGD
jgi:hypothetical protein